MEIASLLDSKTFGKDSKHRVAWYAGKCTMDLAPDVVAQAKQLIIDVARATSQKLGKGPRKRARAGSPIGPGPEQQPEKKIAPCLLLLETSSESMACSQGNSCSGASDPLSDSDTDSVFCDSPYLP